MKTQTAKERILDGKFEANANAGDLVYDPFSGSGTVALACKRNGREFLGSEISSEYCEMITNRLNQELL